MGFSGQPVRWSRLIVDAGLADGWNGPADPAISSVVEDSRQACPGACFVAVRGSATDGHDYIHQAVAAGASAVVCERDIDLPSSVPFLKIDSTRGVAGRLAAVTSGLAQVQRDGRLKVVGITGTNGKSTFCYLLRSILRSANRPTAMLGTVQYDLLSRTITADMTTPPAPILMAYLAESAAAGATHAVMEVSSHALDQGRCDGIRFAVGVFSNLTGDHLDYHKTMADYLRAKKRLFDGLAEDAVAVVNTEDAASETMVADCVARVVRYGIAENDGTGDCDPSCFGWDVVARVLEMTATGSRFELILRSESPFSDAGARTTATVSMSLVGRHNVENALAAAAASWAVGVDSKTIADGLHAIACVPGRLQRVDIDGTGVNVLVDYAHTDDALSNVLSALRPLTDGRLIVLFGCGGDRDRTKRPRMARVAGQYADAVIVTSDNPRTEQPTAIIEDIMAGFTPEMMSKVTVEPDRRQAIIRAITMAETGDVVLLAGKGHETYQLIGGRKIDFDDADVAAEALKMNLAC